jgi:hypothetical protein
MRLINLINYENCPHTKLAGSLTYISYEMFLFFWKRTPYFINYPSRDSIPKKIYPIISVPYYISLLCSLLQTSISQNILNSLYHTLTLYNYKLFVLVTSKSLFCILHSIVCFQFLVYIAVGISILIISFSGLCK